MAAAVLPIFGVSKWVFKMIMTTTIRTSESCNEKKKKKYVNLGHQQEGGAVVAVAAFVDSIALVLKNAFLVTKRSAIAKKT